MGGESNWEFSKENHLTQSRRSKIVCPTGSLTVGLLLSSCEEFGFCRRNLPSPHIAQNKNPKNSFRRKLLLAFSKTGVGGLKCKIKVLFQKSTGKKRIPELLRGMQPGTPRGIGERTDSHTFHDWIYTHLNAKGRTGSQFQLLFCKTEIISPSRALPN